MKTSGAPGRVPVDTVVVGGGIIGICIARHLQRTGRNVTLIERDQPGDGASGHNGGVIAVGECVPTGTPGVLRSIPRMLVDPTSPLVIRYRHLLRLSPWLVRFVSASRASRVEQISIALKSLTDRAMVGYAPLLRDTAAATLVRDGGLLHAYREASAFEADRFKHDLRSRRGVKLDVLDEQGIERVDEALAGRFQRAVYLPEPHFTPDPRQFTKALATQFIEDGGQLCRATVDGFERSNGRVRAVTTTTGRISTDAVVIAAGAWSRRLVRQLGLDVPLETERGYGAYFPDPGVTLRLPVIMADLHIAMRSAPTGLQIVGIDELAGVSAPPKYSVVDRLVRATRQVFPELRTDGVIRWMHCRPSMPDSLPVLGRAPRYANAYLAFGHGHKGLGLGGITGRLIQELMDDDPPSVDLQPYSPTRFSRRGRRHARRVDQYSR